MNYARLARILVGLALSGCLITASASTAATATPAPRLDSVGGFVRAQVVETEVGSTTITFADCDHATFTYTVNGITQTKEVTRQVFAEPGTICQ